MAQLTGRLFGLLRDNLRALSTLAVGAAVVLVPFLALGLSKSAVLEIAATFALLVLLVILGISSRLVFWIACALLAFSLLVQQHVRRNWGAGQLDSRIEAFLESPPGEIRQYLDSHIDVIDIATVVTVCIYLVVLALMLRRMKPPAQKLWWLTLIAIVSAVGLASVPSAAHRLKSFPPIEPVVRATMARHRYTQLVRRSESLSAHPLHVSPCDNRYRKVVIVIGESALSDRMSVFGYPKPTTPFAVASHAYAFDALAPANQTRYSVAMMLTDATPGAFDSFFTSHSLVGQLRACGFHTSWISNQGRRGEYDSFTTALAQEADEQVFLNEWGWADSKLDGELIGAIERHGDFDRTRQATFIHLIGSHTNYAERYPPGFGFASVKSVEEQYDNSLLYTDHVLSELHRRFGDDRVLFVYASDHGQIVSNARFGSGFLPGYQDEFRTPFLIWTDDQQSMQSLRAAIGTARLNLESLDDVVHYLLGMTPELRISTSTKVSVLTPEIVRDYDALAKLPRSDP